MAEQELVSFRQREASRGYSSGSSTWDIHEIRQAGGTSPAGWFGLDSDSAIAGVTRPSLAARDSPHRWHSLEGGEILITPLPSFLLHLIATS